MEPQTLINALFYSKNNTALYNDLKRMGAKHQIKLAVACDFSNFLTLLHSTNMSMVIIDNTKNNLSDEMIDFINHYEKMFGIIVIVLGNGSCEKISRESIFIMSPNDLMTGTLDLKKVLLIIHEINAVNLAEDAYLTKCIVTELVNLGIDPKLDGFKYLREAVLVSLKQNFAGDSLSTHVYPIVALMFHSKSANIERNIRSAIKSAVKTPKFQKSELCKINPNPTNRQIIKFLVEIININNRKGGGKR